MSGTEWFGAMVLCLVCVALAVATGGIDRGEGATGAGPSALFLALALGAPAAAIVAWRVAPLGAFRPRPVRIGLAAAAGLAAWSALSILWASAPDLAWLDANRAALALCALILGVSVARVAKRPGAMAAVGLTAVAVPVALWGMAGKVAPTLVGPDRAIARLAEPMGYWNAVALLVGLGVPGALWLATRPSARVWERAAAASAVALLLVTLLLTYSRAGLVVSLATVGVCMWLAPRGTAQLGVFLAGAAGAVLPVAYALTTDTLTTDGLTAAARSDAGISLGWRVVVGLVVAALLVLLALRFAPRLRPHEATLRRTGIVAVAVVAAAVAVLGVVKFDAVADRVDRVFEGSGVDNSASRFTDPNLNGRLEWAGEALRGFADAPLTGQGAGGFRLIHLAERDDAPNPREAVRHPHQLATQMAGELGIVGFLLLAALVGAVAWAAIRAQQRRDDPTIGFAIAAAAGFMLHVQVDWTWSIPGVAVPALVVCGVVLGSATEPADVRRPLPSWAAPALAVVTAATVVSAFLPWQSARTLEAGSFDRPFSHAATARTLNPLSIEPDIFEAAVAGTRDPGRALASARRATRKQPDNPRSWRALLRAGAVGGEADTARARVKTLDPLGQQP